MLTSTVLYPLTTALTIVLLVEAIIYTWAGVSDFFDDFHRKPPLWVYVNGRLNARNWSLYKQGHKMHAGLTLLLGLVALNGLIEGFVSQFEMELIFVGLAMLFSTLLSMMIPTKRMTFFFLAIAPEFWLQVVMFILFADLIRPQVIGLCVILNLWGVFVYVRKTCRMDELPQTYEQFRQDLVAAGDTESFIKFMDKVAGHQPSPSSDPKK